MADQATINRIRKLAQERADRMRNDETEWAKLLRELFPEEYPTWGAALTAACKIVANRKARGLDG